jgi:hypothetical protein
MLRKREEILHRKNCDVRNERRLLRILSRQIQFFESGLLRKESYREYAVHTTRLTREGEFSEKKFLRWIDIHLTRRDEKCDCEREVVDRCILRHIRRCEIGRDSTRVVWRFESGILQCRTHSVPRFFHGSIGKSHQSENMQTLGENIHLHLDREPIEPERHR